MNETQFQSLKLQPVGFLFFFTLQAHEIKLLYHFLSVLFGYFMMYCIDDA